METATAERLRVEYVLVSKAVEWDWEENPKEHDIGALCASIQRYGFLDPPKYDSTLERFVYGNGRTKALLWLCKQNEPPPRGILVDEETGEWAMPVLFGVDAESVAIATAFAIDHNNLTMAGGSLEPWEQARVWSPDYIELLEKLATTQSLPVTVDGEDLDGLKGILGYPNAAPYQELDQSLQNLSGYEDVTIAVCVPAMHADEVREYLANGESRTSTGMGKGILRRCGLL